jgi:hypothetical protein
MGGWEDLEGGEAKGGDADEELEREVCDDFEIHNALPQPST